MIKTNVMRLLEQANIKYDSKEYEVDESDLSGVHVARQIGIPMEQVFKTLVARGDKKGYLVFVIPVNTELNLKKAAMAIQDKKVELVHVKELLGLTGYIRGGCSPIGMKKKFPTFIDETAILFDTITISAGVRGCQIMINPEELREYIDGSFCELTD